MFLRQEMQFSQTIVRWTQGSTIVVVVALFTMLGCSQPQFLPKPKVFKSFYVYPLYEPLLLEKLGAWDSLQNAQTFSVLIKKVEGVHPIALEQIAFFVRSLVESLGYQYIDSERQQPDFWISVRAILQSGGNILVQVDVWDATAQQVLWSGRMVGSEMGIRKASARFWEDPRVLCQQLVAYLVFNYIPRRKGQVETDSEFFGLRLQVLSLDGNSFYPVVVGVLPQSLAQQAGFRREDIVVAINGQSTRNKSWAEILHMFAKAELPLSVKVWRDVTPPRKTQWKYVGSGDGKVVSYGPLRFRPMTLTLQLKIKKNEDQ